MAQHRAPRPTQDWTEYRIPRGGQGIELLRAYFRGHAYERHSHESYALGVTEEGVQAFYCRGAAQASLPGQIVALNPDDPHDGHAARPEGFTYRMLYVPPALMRGVLEAAGDGRPAALPYARAPVLEDRPLAAGLARLHGALAEEATGLAVTALIDEVLVRFARRHGDGGFAPGAVVPGEAALRRVRDLLRDTSLAEEPDAATLERAAGISRYHLWRAFRRRFGLPPHAYRLQLRLAAAKRLLARGEAPAAVAAELGFTDQSHLHKRFKGAFGITPGAFARAARAR